MPTNPMISYVEHFRANLPSGVTFDSNINRYFYNGTPFANEWEVEWYRNYILKLGSGGAAGISKVGYVSATSTSNAAPPVLGLTALTGGTDSAPSEGDLVVVYISHAFANDPAGEGINLAGYTPIQALVTDNASFRDTEGLLAYKFMGATPDTDVTFTLNNTAPTNLGITIEATVLRGVDPDTPLNVGPLTVSNLTGPAVAMPAITTTVAGAAILAVASNSVSSFGLLYADPGGYDDFNTINANDTIANAQAMAFQIKATAGEFAADTWVDVAGTAPNTTITSQGIIVAFNPA